MNMLDVQDKLKGLSEQQLVQEMQMPSGSAPQFLVLSEITRRKRMRDSMQQQPDNSTVAQEAVAAAGVPQGGIADMAMALAPKTDMTQNTGAMPVQGMYGGGYVQKMQPGGLVALQRNPAALAFAQREAQRLGMSLEQYVSRMSLPPQSRGAMDSSSLDRFLQTQADRNRMLGFEPVGDGAEFPTQSDLDRRFQQQQQAEQFAFGASSPLTSPGPLDANVGMPRQAGRVIGAPSVASVAPQMPSIGDVFDARVESPLSPLPASGPYSTVPSALMTAENERVRLERGIPGGEGFDERAYTAPGPATLPSTGPYSRVQSALEMAENERIRTEMGIPGGEGFDERGYIAPAPATQPDTGPYSRVQSALELAQEEYDRTASGIPGGEGFDERAYTAPAPRSEERPTYPGWGANTEMQPYETLRSIQDFFSGGEGVSPVEPDAGESMSGLTQEDIERLKTPAQPEPTDVVTVPDRDRQASPSVPQPGGAKTTPTANDLIADTTTGGTRTSGGVGSASGATSYEQELINAMQRAERRAEQDKWLALAQVGLGLMSSTQPTIGGALGEAGIAGLESYRGARDEYETERLGLSKELAGIEAARASQRAAAAKASSGPTLQQLIDARDALYTKSTNEFGEDVIAPMQGAEGEIAQINAAIRSRVGSMAAPTM
jgi:hypothetical protein